MRYYQSNKTQRYNVYSNKCEALVTGTKDTNVT